MPDNINVKPSTEGTAVAVATEEGSGSRHYQLIVLCHGVKGSELRASLTNPLPIRVETLPLPTGAAAETTLGATKTIAEAIRDRLPSALEGGKLSIALDISALATNAVLQAVRDRLPTTLEGGRLAVALDISALATNAVAQAIRDRLPSALTAEGRLKVETQGGGGTSDTLEATQLNVKAAAESIRDRLPSALESGKLSVKAEVSSIPSTNQRQKTTRELIAIGTSVSAGGTVTGTGFDITNTDGGDVLIQVTNGGTAPSVECTVRLEHSHDSGTTWLTFSRWGGGTSANTTLSSYPIAVPGSFQRIRAVATGNTGQAVTVAATFMEQKYL